MARVARAHDPQILLARQGDKKSHLSSALRDDARFDTGFTLNWFQTAIESSASDTISEFFTLVPQFAPLGYYGRKFGVQLCDKSGAGVNSATITFTLIGAPTWLYLDEGRTSKTANIVTASADLNPKVATTDTRNGVACCQLTHNVVFGEPPISPSSGTYVLRATYGNLTRDLLCHYEAPSGANTPMVIALSGGTTLESPLSYNSNAVGLTYGPYDETGIGGANLSLVRLTFAAIDGSFNATNGSGGFGLVNFHNISGPLVQVTDYPTYLFSNSVGGVTFVKMKNQQSSSGTYQRCSLTAKVINGTFEIETTRYFTIKAP